MLTFYICIICYIFKGQILEYIYIYVPTHEVPSINHMTRRMGHILHKEHFILLTYITEQIRFPHYKHMSHCPYSLWSCRCNTGAYRYQRQMTCSIYFTCYCYIYMLETNMPTILHIYTIFRGICRGYAWKYMPHSHCHQPCDQDWCTHRSMPMLKMPIMLTQIHNCTGYTGPAAQISQEEAVNW